MNRSVAVVLGVALAAGLTAGAAAQQQPPAQTAPWPSSAPPAQAAPWPSSAPPAQGAPSAQGAPWPSSPQQPSAFPSGGGAAPVFGAPPPPQAQQMPAVCASFPKLRDEASQRASVVQETGKKHADRAAMCSAVTRFYEAEQKVVKFLEDNKKPCGVPDQAVQQAKLIHANTLKFRDTVCAEGPKPKIPTLSDAITTTPVDTPKNTRTGPGTFNTLTGNPLGN